jgi:ABC-type sugar transport system permease subunit
MPAGPSELGFFYFAAVKFVGYTGYCKLAIDSWIKRHAETATAAPSPWTAGGVRTLIGIAVGVAVGGGFWALAAHSAWGESVYATVAFFTLLIPIRVVEWRLMWRWMYKPAESATDYGWVIAGGVVTSFVLDGLGILAALVVPGGSWVC